MKTRITQRKNKIVKLCFILIVILGFKQTSYAQQPPNSTCDGVLDFDGSNDYVNNGTLEHPNNLFTVEFWANISSSSQWIHIIENGNIENGSDCAYRIEIGSQGEIYFAMGSGTSFVNVLLSTGWQYGEWNHYAFTYDGNTARVYLNGIEENNFSTTIDITQGDGTLLFSSSQGLGRYYDGKLDEVRIWDVVKTAPEIVASMSTQLTGSETGLLGYWNFNDRSGATLTDASPSGNHGTLTNMDTLLNWVSEDGSAFNFKDVVMVCNGESYTFPDGSTQNNITSQVVQTSTMVTGDGCDSIIETTVNVIIDISVTNTSSILTANQLGATYQWLDCDNGNVPISGEINQTFTATTAGNYAVEITIGSCTNTSSCYFVAALGVDDVDLLKDITIYPNPTNNFITVTSSNLNNVEQFVLYDIEGRLIYQSKNITNNIIKIDFSTVTKGIYILKVSRDSNSKVFKVIRN